MVTEARLLQPMKAPGSMDLIELGIIMDVKLVHHLKVELPMHVTELGMVTEVRLLQPSKAQPHMLVTELGMVTWVRLVQPLKVLLSIVVTELGIAMEARLLQPSKAQPSMFVTVLGMVTEVRPQLLKAWLPMRVTTYSFPSCVFSPGIVYVSLPEISAVLSPRQSRVAVPSALYWYARSLVQPMKAPLPILVTELGMVTEVRLLQLLYLLLVDYQYYTL